MIDNVRDVTEGCAISSQIVTTLILPTTSLVSFMGSSFLQITPLYFSMKNDKLLCCTDCYDVVKRRRNSVNSQPLPVIKRLGWCGILMQAEVLQHRMLVHPSSGACDLLWIYFMCCIALVRCVLVLWCGSAGVVWYPYAG